MGSYLLHIGVGLGVVGVGADEDTVVLIVQRGCRQLRHLADHAMLLPGGHHDGQRLLVHPSKAL
jgi:hypothetical protein